MPQTVSLEALNTASQGDFVDKLSGIFEHAPWVAEHAYAARPFATLVQLHTAMMQSVQRASAQEQVAFIAAHPDLAGKAARAGTITPASVSEQSGLGLDRLSDDEFALFERLNAAYRQKFGFPFVICVRRQTRDAVLDAFDRRLKHDIATERQAALDEIAYITRLRIVDRVDGVGAPAVAGHLSTHVLDTYHGQAAANVAIELFEVGRSARARLAAVTTNRSGRTEQPLISKEPLRIGTYELVFHVGDYFRASGAASSERPFLDQVPIRFGISAPEGHYHIPLVVTPWSYSTYRGT